MASKFQSRLIGTVILVAIGVIVLPDVFDGQKKHYQEEFAAIPIKPTDEVNELVSDEVKEPVELDVPLPKEPVPVVTVQSDQKSESIEEPKKTVTAQVADQEDRSEVKDVSEPKIIPVREKNKYADSAWIIQLVALKNQDNAKKLVTDLQKRGFQAHLKT